MTADVRTLSPQDWQAWRDAYLRAAGDGAVDRRDGGEDEWRAWIEGAGLSLVAEIDGTPVGLASVRESGAEVELTSLWATADDVGELLLDKVFGWATKETAADRIVVGVKDGDPVLKGFDAVSRTDPRIRNAGPRVMVRRIPRGVRVGVHSGQQYSDFASVQALWHDAERLGFDWVSLFDHFRPPIFGPDGPCFDGTSLLSALAATTSRVRCGLMVTPPVWRHPALTATAAATIDHVSGGRFELGVGVGSSDLAFEQYGIAQESLKTRFDQLDEACHVLRLLFDGGPVDFDGDHFRLNGAHLSPRPLQRRLPLTIGGSGEKRTLPLIVAHADIWNCALMPEDVYARTAGVLARLCEEAGRAPGDIRRSMTFRAVITSSRDEAERARHAIVENHHGHRQDLPEYVSFGSAQECVDRLAPYVELGVRDFLLGLRPPLDRESMARFAEEVAPELRRMVTA